MAVLTEGTYAGESIMSESNGTRSRETVTVLSGQNLSAGAVLGKVTASGKYVAYTVGASDGSQNAVAILFDAVDATSGDKEGVILARDMEANKLGLVWGGTVTTQGHKDTAYASLATVGIIAR